jgi:hypothetical protein
MGHLKLERITYDELGGINGCPLAWSKLRVLRGSGEPQGEGTCYEQTGEGCGELHVEGDGLASFFLV